METIIIHADSKKMKALKAFLKAFEISFTVSNIEEAPSNSEKKGQSPYDPKFVSKILKRLESSKKGNTVEINPNDLWGSLGLK